MNILIAGAGPTGLTAAVELARRGVSVDIIDQKDGPSILSRAVGILPSSLKLLTPAGVTPKLIAKGVKIQEVQVFSGSNCMLNLSLRNGHPEHDYVIALAQDQTEAILHDALVQFGGSVDYGKALTGLRHENEQVVVETNDGMEKKYDYVIGADGIQSTTRQCLGIEYPGFNLAETWSIADVNASNWQNANVFTICVLSGGRVVVVAPLEAQRYRVISNTEDALKTLPLNLDVTNIHREGQFQISIRQVPEYNVGRVFLAGDAAHCHSPVGGRGMNLGISDAADLAARITEGGLDSYSSFRHTEGARTIATSERARKLITSTSGLKKVMLATGCHLINAVPSLQQRVARTILNS